MGEAKRMQARQAIQARMKELRFIVK